MRGQLFQSTPPVKAATDLFMRIWWAGIISIHAAREGGDHLPAMDDYTLARFQSTPPVKAATRHRNVLRPAVCISIHAAREGGDRQDRKSGSESAISIHAAREGGDFARKKAVFPQSCISIHAAREGGDLGYSLTLTCTRYFNPRRP